MRRFLSILVLVATAGAAPSARANEAAQSMRYEAEFAQVLAAPDNASDYYGRLEQARAELLAKHWKVARTLFAQLVIDYPLDRETWTGLATAERELGRHEASIAAYLRSIALIGPVPGSARYWIAVQQAKLGDKEAAFATLQTMIADDHELDRPGLLADPAFESLHDDARWSTLAAPSSATKDRVAGWNGDLDWLLAEARRLIPAYRDAVLPAPTRAAAEALRVDLPKLSDAEVYARLAQLLGTLDLGHTMLWGAGPDGPAAGTRLQFSWLPVLLYAFPEGLFVVHADDAHRALIGRRVEAIDGVDAKSVFDAVASATSFASPAEALWTVPVRTSDMLLLHGLGIAKAADHAMLTLIDGNGARADVNLVAGAWNPRAKLPTPPDVEAPLFLGRAGEAHWAEFWPQHSTTYVQFNQVAPDPDEDLPTFGKRLRKMLTDNASRNVIIDLRHNNGGNTFTYMELLRTMTAFSVEEGHHVYAVIGRSVYSAAANFSTELERLAKPVFVGEPTAATGNQDGDEANILLPWSGISATVSGVRWQLSHPWDRRVSIVPQVPMTMTAADYFAGRDPVLETVKAMIAREDPTRGP